MKWLMTAHRDWERLDLLQFEVDAPTREEAIEAARREIDSPERDSAWSRGKLRLRNSGFIVTPGEKPC